MARLLASDIEAKGFYERVNTKEDIHCFCSIDIETDEVFLFHDYPHFDNVVVLDPFDNREYTIPPRTGTLEEGLRFWESETLKGSTLIIHNAHTYDRIIINKIWPDNQIPFESYHDTFIQSKVQWFERPCPRGVKSAHGLKAYGIKLGINKPEIEDWESMDAFKLHRVIEDCKIQAGCYSMLEKERAYLNNTFGMDFTQGLKIEALYANENALQEIKGVKIDEAHFQRCLIDLDQKIELLRQEIEPQLPAQISCPSEKIARSVMAQLFGLKKIPVDKIIQRKQNGEIINVVEKPYHKPVMKWTNVEKVTVYSAFNLSFGSTPTFMKKKDLTDYLKGLYGKAYKAADWEFTKDVIEKEVVNKFYCKWFDIEPDSDMIAGAFTRIEIEQAKLSQSDVVKRFLIKLGWRYAEEWNLKKDMFGDYIKAEHDMEVRWPEDALPEHQLVKKIKKGGLIVSTPKLTEDDYKQLPEGIGKKIAEYNTYQHRRRFISNVDDDEKGLLSYVDARGRVPAGVNNFNTRSGRASHRVIVNVPSAKALYGEEIRSGFIADDGKMLVGADQKSSQLSIAAYFANNVDYYTAVASGNEYDEDGKYIGQTAHCVNSRMFGMVTQEEYELALKTQEPALLKSIAIRRGKSKGGSFCLPKDITEVYTKEGWKKYDDLCVGMEVLTYNRDTKVNEFKPIQHIVTFDQQPVIAMGNSRWSFESTAEHRWLGLRRTGRGVHYEVEEFITTADIKSEFKIYNSAKRKDINHSWLTPNEAAILGWILSDGSIQWSEPSTRTSSVFGTKRGVKCVIHQTEKKFIKEIESLLEAESACTGRYTVKEVPSGLIRCYTLKAEYVRYLFRKAKLPFACKHSINYSELINNLNNEALEAFMQAFWEGDGCTYMNTRRLAQIEGNLLNCVLEALMLLGVNYSLHEKKDYYGSKHKCIDIHYKVKNHTGSTNFKKEVVGNKDVFCHIRM